MRFEGDHPTAAVVGSGVGANVAALLLARIGFRVTLLAHADRTYRRSTDVVVLDPASVALLAELGAPSFGTGAHRRQAVVTALTALLVDEPLITAVDAEVLEVNRHGEVWFACGDVVHHQAVDLVVGADGSGSVVRAGGDFGARVRRSRRFFVHAVVHDGPRAAGHEQSTAIGQIGWFPLTDGSTWFYADVTSDQSAAAVLAGDAAELLRIWRIAAPAAAPVLDAFDDRTSVSLIEATSVAVRHRHDGRLALIGAAARNAGLPTGRGANRAIADAVALASALGDADAVPEALAQYDLATQDTHRPRTTGWLAHRRGRAALPNATVM